MNLIWNSTFELLFWNSLFEPTEFNFRTVIQLQFIYKHVSKFWIHHNLYYLWLGKFFWLLIIHILLFRSMWKWNLMIWSTKESILVSNYNFLLWYFDESNVLQMIYSILLAFFLVQSNHSIFAFKFIIWTFVLKFTIWICFDIQHWNFSFEIHFLNICFEIHFLNLLYSFNLDSGQLFNFSTSTNM